MLNQNHKKRKRTRSKTGQKQSILENIVVKKFLKIQKSR